MANTPKDEVDQKRDEALRRMLNTPRQPHDKKTSQTPAKRDSIKKSKSSRGGSRKTPAS